LKFKESGSSEDKPLSNLLSTSLDFCEVVIVKVCGSHKKSGDYIFCGYVKSQKLILQNISNTELKKFANPSNQSRYDKKNSQQHVALSANTP
jgi:hypothetical protein